MDTTAPRLSCGRSPAFQALPPAAKEQTLDGLREVLAGEITAPKYAHLTPAIRQATTEILKETK